MMVKNAGMPSVGSAKSMSVVCFIIKKPTRMSAGAVAADGISKNTGENSNARTNIAAVVNAVKPVLPPAATPAVLST